MPENTSQSRRQRRADRHVALTEVPPILPGQIKATLDQLAVRYAVSPDFAEKHKAHWGPEPMSEASNSKLRYDIATADSWWADRRRPPGPYRRPGAKPKPKAPTHTPGGAALLPVIDAGSANGPYRVRKRSGPRVEAFLRARGAAPGFSHAGIAQ